MRSTWSSWIEDSLIVEAVETPITIILVHFRFLNFGSNS